MISFLWKRLLYMISMFAGLSNHKTPTVKHLYHQTYVVYIENLFVGLSQTSNTIGSRGWKCQKWQIVSNQSNLVVITTYSNHFVSLLLSAHLIDGRKSEIKPVNLSLPSFYIFSLFLSLFLYSLSLPFSKFPFLFLSLATYKSLSLLLCHFLLLLFHYFSLWFSVHYFPPYDLSPGLRCAPGFNCFY